MKKFLSEEELRVQALTEVERTHQLLAQRPLAQYPDEYFDDNKPYLVMYLTILFKRISGSKTS